VHGFDGGAEVDSSGEGDKLDEDDLDEDDSICKIVDGGDCISSGFHHWQCQSFLFLYKSLTLDA